jgi:hypothetical protein
LGDLGEVGEQIVRGCRLDDVAVDLQGEVAGSKAILGFVVQASSFQKPTLSSRYSSITEKAVWRWSRRTT